jgi:hypothetical protein
MVFIITDATIIYIFRQPETTGEKGGWVGGSKILDRIYIHTYKITCLSVIIKTIKYYENTKYSFKLEAPRSL